MFANQGRRRRALVAALLSFLVAAVPALSTAAAGPAQLRIPAGAVKRFRPGAPWVAIRQRGDPVVRLAARGAQGWLDRLLGEPVAIESLRRGRAELEISLFGWLPLRRLAIDVVPPLHIVPGGHSIGVQLESQGVMVVGFSALTSPEGASVEPGRAAGLELSDIIVSANGETVLSEDRLARIVDESGRAGRPVELEVRRGGAVQRRQVRPALDRDSGRFRIGLYVRGGAAGIGTLTFYDPRTRRYAALGHIISDADTGQPIDMRRGFIVSAAVSSIDRGTRENPGEKLGLLDDQPLGTIERNTLYGIVGTAFEDFENPLFAAPLPIGLADQVETGPAELLTVVEGRRIERFAIEITRVMRQDGPGTRGMVVRIVDPRLLRKTGGIVQGMSGSPILQGGRIVGAVTHVFVTDPTRGYGVFIERMLRESGVFPAEGAWNQVPGALWPARILSDGPSPRAAKVTGKRDRKRKIPIETGMSKHGAGEDNGRGRENSLGNPSEGAFSAS